MYTKNMLKWFCQWFLFYAKKDIDINAVTLQKEEVDYIKYMSVDEIKNLIKTQKMLKSHALMFEVLLKKIKNN